MNDYQAQRMVLLETSVPIMGTSLIVRLAAETGRRIPTHSRSIAARRCCQGRWSEGCGRIAECTSRGWTYQSQAAAPPTSTTHRQKQASRGQRSYGPLRFKH